MTDVPTEPIQAINQDCTALGRPHEAVIHVTRVQVGSRDIARGVDAEGDGSLSCGRACARSLEVGYLPIGSAHKAVCSAIGVEVDTRNIASPPPPANLPSKRWWDLTCPAIALAKADPPRLAC